jgi:hypothetical protein
VNSALLLGLDAGPLGDQLLQSHGVVREVPDRLQVLAGNPLEALSRLRFPLRDLCLVDPEVEGQLLRGAGDVVKPNVEFHARSLQTTRPKGQDISRQARLTQGATSDTLRSSMDKQRRERFVEYYNRNWRDRGGRKAFMAKTGFKKARVSQLFDESVSFGERAGRRLAVALGLPENYFDVTEGGRTRKALELARIYDAWPDCPEKDVWYAMTTLFLESKVTPEGTAGEPGPFDVPNLRLVHRTETHAESSRSE